MKTKVLKFILNRLMLLESILLFICLIKKSYSLFFILALIILVIMLALFIYLNNITKE